MAVAGFWFVKVRGSVAPPGGPIRCPEVVRRLDYEGELTIVIGVGGQIGGYCVADDVTGRDLQVDPAKNGDPLAGRGIRLGQIANAQHDLFVSRHAKRFTFNTPSMAIQHSNTTAGDHDGGCAGDAIVRFR